MKRSVINLSFVFLLLMNCSNDSSYQNNTTEEVINAETVAFEENIYSMPENNYWNQGLAEMSSYKLIQGRYGEEREGEAVLIYVTEPFSKSKQVKLDYSSPGSNDQIDILKLNMSRKFNTGIYPYSLMSSIFTPINEFKTKETIKLTTSIQEWCGHVYAQLNKTANAYDFQSFSYFESEGDERKNLGDVKLEQELWNQIRINPNSIEEGKTRLVPSMEYLRFKHIETREYEAEISQSKKGAITSLQINYLDIKRMLTINYSNDFPHAIESWEEIYESGYGANKKVIQSSGELIHRKMIDYWNYNKNSDAPVRKEFGLD